MEFDKIQFAFFSENQIFGKNKLKVFKKIGTKAAIPDYVISLGGYASDTPSLENRTGIYWTKMKDGNNDVFTVDYYGDKNFNFVQSRYIGIRSFFFYDSIKKYCTNLKKVDEEISELEFGLFSNKATEEEIQIKLNTLEQMNQLQVINSITDSRKQDEYGEKIKLSQNKRIKYQEKIYEKVKANTYGGKSVLLSIT